MAGVYKVKMITLMRTDLNMRKGKMVAQGQHAAILAYKTASRDDPAFIEWDSGPFAKICVGVDSEEILLEVIRQAEKAGLNVALIQDAGVTEFHGVPTITCAAIGPAYIDDLDPITSTLKLI